jgi:DegV family protein with EDD domain
VTNKNLPEEAAMSKVAFVTDSTCNMPEELSRQHNIKVVPVYVIFDGQSYRDYFDMPPAMFYQKLAEQKAAGKGMPTTSQPTPEDFRKVYDDLGQQGFSDVISIHVTAKSSGTVQSATLAAGMVNNIKVHVVDSATTSMAMGYMLLDAIDIIAKGSSVSPALDSIEYDKAHSSLIFTVTDVEHLAASGRTEGAEKATEAAIAVKPIVSVLGGVPKAVGAERTQGAALQKVLDLTREQIGTAKLKHLAVVNGNIADRAMKWSTEAASALGFEGPVHVVDFGPALAVHFGPGLLGVAAIWE